MKLWGFWPTDQCPCCGAVNETTTHPACCPDPWMTDTFKTATAEFLVWLEASEPAPCILAYFQAALPARGEPFILPQILPSSNTAVQQQQALGFDNLLCGRITVAWHRIQSSFLLSSGSRRTTDRWMASLVEKVLSISLQMWITRNLILHERDERGLLLEEGQVLREAIDEAMDTDPSTLLAEDCHLLQSQSWAEIHSLPASNQYTWLFAFRSAETLAEESTAATAQLQQQTLDNWFQADIPPAPDP